MSSEFKFFARVLAAAVVAGAVFAGSASADVSAFGQDSIWNKPLTPQAQLSTRSADWVQHLDQSVDTNGGYINTTSWSAPVYTVPATQPRVPVQLPSNVRPDIKLAFSAVPIPQGAKPSPDNDSEMIIWQPSTNSMWEMFEVGVTSSWGWKATYGGMMTPLSLDLGFFKVGGAAATGLPLLGGLIRISELQAGNIPHALSLSIPEPKAGQYAWPAQRTDGTSTDANAIPEGARFRLPASLDLSTLNLSPATRTIAVAAQKYGVYVSDRSGSVAFEAEDPAQFGSNPYPALFSGKSPSTLMAQFPWDKLQVVDAPLSGS